MPKKEPYDPTPVQIALGQILKKLRTDRNETIHRVARKSKISRSVIWALENATRNFRLVTLYTICEYYKVEPRELMAEATKEAKGLK
jgi:transcriptional regulator with XRE-family HTH domain